MLLLQFAYTFGVNSAADDPITYYLIWSDCRNLQRPYVRTESLAVVSAGEVKVTVEVKVV